MVGLVAQCVISLAAIMRGMTVGRKGLSGGGRFRLRPWMSARRLALALTNRLARILRRYRACGGGLGSLDSM